MTVAVLIDSSDMLQRHAMRYQAPITVRQQRTVMLRISKYTSSE
jgi:hypothetical protein